MAAHAQASKAFEQLFVLVRRDALLRRYAAESCAGFMIASYEKQVVDLT